MEKLEEKHWLPIECNPEIFTKFASKLGFPSIDLAFYDVVSLDPEMWMAMIPSPVAAVIVAFPIKEWHQEFRKQQIEEQKIDGKEVVFIRERIENGCATLCLLHALLNVQGFLINGGFIEGSFLDKFQIANMDADSEEMWDYLLNDTEIEKIHQECALEGKSSIENATGSHFITFVEKDGLVYELDGRLPQPIWKGEIEGANLGIKVSSIINEYMQMDPEENKFSMLALAQNFGGFDF